MKCCYMILIDALYINNGGGKILLDYLISELNKTELDIYFLLDERIAKNHPEINSNRVKYLKGSILRRFIFYKRNRKKFSKVLCFGNLPPNIRLNSEVLTYFHQPMYLDIPKEFSLLDRLIFKLKVCVLKYIANNSDYWLVQSNLIKEKLQQNFNFESNTIKILPFYPQFDPVNLEFKREINTYFYVSNATPHKNHKKLINVFCSFYDKYKKGELTVTVSDSYPEVIKLINEKIKEGYPIVNIGFVNRIELQKKYLTSEFLIFPSLAESFGLGLIEAIECGCKVIAADLPYTYEVCDPTLIFNPINKDSIFDAFKNSLNKQNLKSSLPRIQNNINQIISLLK